MKLTSTFGIALRALRRNKLRSILTMLGIIIGVGAVIAMVGIGNGARADIEAKVASLGENVIPVWSGSTTSSGVHSGSGGAGTLKVEDCDAIASEVVGVAGVSPEIRAAFQVVAGSQNWLPQILGESLDYFAIRHLSFTEGGPFTPQDVRGANKVCVIGQTTARQLFGDESPVGQKVRIKQAPFIIVGVLAPKGMSPWGSDQDDVIVMPYTSAMRRLLGQTMIRSMLVQAESASVMPRVQQEITALLRQRHRIVPPQADDFTVRSLDEMMATQTETAKTMTILLGSVAGVSLIVGGIGIMNIMLVSVTERTREIGIRMAVGAHGIDILMQFLVEALTLSSLGGLIGVAAGLGASRIIAATAGWLTIVSVNAIVLSFLFSALVGIFFGLYPARKAAALDPIDALRYE